jgi:hypothetical protein
MSLCDSASSWLPQFASDYAIKATVSFSKHYNFSLKLSCLNCLLSHGAHILPNGIMWPNMALPCKKLEHRPCGVMWPVQVTQGTGDRMRAQVS